jgi:hypothetical protein
VVSPALAIGVMKVPVTAKKAQDGKTIFTLADS